MTEMTMVGAFARGDLKCRMLRPTVRPVAGWCVPPFFGPER